jgi:hypothetical protein
VIRIRIARGILIATAHELVLSDRRRAGSDCRRAREETPSFITPVKRTSLRAVVLLASWAIGLLVAGWIVPGVSISASGFVVAVLVFAATQAILSLPILALPHRYVSLLLGGTGLAVTIGALIFASMLTDGLTIAGVAPWLATTVVVWLMTTIGAVTLPELLRRDVRGTT